MAIPYLGDIYLGQTIRHMWNTYDVDGNSILRATNGTISIYEDGGTTQFTTGVTDTENFDSITGVHLIEVDTSAANYERGKDYICVLTSATIDGSTVNSALFTFSIENRTGTKDQVIFEGVISAADTTTITLNGSDTGSAINSYYDGCLIYPVSGTGAGQAPRFASTEDTYVGSTKVITLANPFVVTLSTDTRVRIIKASVSTVTFPNNFDGLVIDSSGVFDTNVVQWKGLTTIVDNIEDDYDGTGFAKTNSVIGTVSLVSALAAASITSGVLADDCITSAKLAASAIAEIQAGLNDISASEVWAEALGSTGMSASALLQIAVGVAAGKISGAATTTVTIRNIQDSNNMIVATVDNDGNRSAISITTPAD